MAAIHDNLQAVRERISLATRAAGRDEGSVRLLAVSKTQAAAAVQVAAQAGQRAFGENYVQEGIAKMDALRGRIEDAEPALEWHLIGPLQSNKTRVVAERFDWVHAVESARIARRLSDARPADGPPLNVLIQVNVSGEASKSGVGVDEVPALAQEMAALPRLHLRGLMAIPEPTDDRALQRRRFATVRECFASLRAAGLDVDTLSMGMSADMEAAIAEGATMVRIGTAIFGERA